MDYKNNFEKGKEIILSTSSKDGKPNANIVVSLGLIDDKLLVADCQMETTIENLKNNPSICVVGGYFKIKGKVEILNNGKYFDMCIKKNSSYKVKNALLITIEEVFDLDKCQKVEN